MLLDKFLPEYHFNEVHRITIRASPDRIYQAIKDVHASEIFLFRELMMVRALPAQVLRRTRLRRTYEAPLLQQVLKGGSFVLLAEEPGRELVVGTVGRFWQISGGQVKLWSAQEFIEIDRPDYAKAALNFYIHEVRRGPGVRLRTETRICVPDLSARRKFAAYWFFIQAGSAFMRLMWLRAIKRKVETLAPASSHPVS
jgi:hypothetical protein